ncbi:MAG: hypothetical protein A2Y33_13870 [Spirochaetes bacterium GWF1_51_8]|nr:MAG: hypothetical protein A2Y33_13870 [Spirochaetes bacterium GWF1_51_8]
MKIRWLILILLTGVSINLFAQLPKYLYGVASYYSDEYTGKKTASGDLYDPSKMTAAHKTLPFGSVVEVENLENGEKVIVMINDRGPFAEGRLIDLSKSAAQSLDFINKGTAYVMVTMIKLGSGDTKDVNLKDYQNAALPPATNTNLISPTTLKPIMTEKLSNGIISIEYYVTNVLTKVMTKTNSIYITNKIIKIVTNVYTNTIKGNIPKTEKVYENDVTTDPLDADKIKYNNDELIIEEPFEEPFDPAIKPVDKTNANGNKVTQPIDNNVVQPDDKNTSDIDDVPEKNTNIAVNDNNVVDLTVPVDDNPEVSPDDIEDMTVDVGEDKVIEVDDGKVTDNKTPVITQEVTPEILIDEGESLNDTAIEEEKSIIYDEIEMDFKDTEKDPVKDPVKPNKNNNANTQNGKTEGDKIKIVEPDEYVVDTEPNDKTKIVPIEPEIEIDTDYVPGMAGEKYMVQVGAFKDFKNAQKLYDKLKSMGYNVVMKDTFVKGALFYRVRLGYYDSLDTAMKVAAKMKALNIPAILVKITISSDGKYK